MEEELFAVTHFIVDETKLKTNTSQGHFFIPEQMMINYF